MQINLQVEGVRETAEYFRAAGSRDLPITMAATLSRLAAKAQREIRILLGEHFILRRPAWARSGVRIEPATKSKWVAAVKDINPYMELQQTGGEKIPYGKFIAVPLSGARPTPASLIAAHNRPHAVMAAGGFIRNGIMYAVLIGKPRGRAQRFTGRVVPMYVLVSSAEEKPRYGFDLAVEKVVELNYREEFGKAWDEFSK